MNRTCFMLVATLVVALSSPAGAACYADYKAKQDNPLQLHYGVIELRSASCGNSRAVAREVQQRIARAGWELLNIVSTFDEDGLDQRRASAGEFFLRF